MNRRTFLSRGCACGALIMAAGPVEAAAAAAPAPAKDDFTHPVRPDQVMEVLSDVDRSGDLRLIDGVFTRWGFHCFHARKDLVAFAERQRADFQGYVDYVNGNRARYWERLDYDKDAGVLRVTSRKFGKCPCAWAQCAAPAKALCTHCCKALQTELFRTMTGRNAEVRIDESILLGGERCRTTVRLLGNAPT